MPAPSLPDPVDFSAGEYQLGPYRLLRPISAGGMARVYEGRLDSLAGVTTRVAVKVIHPDFANETAFQELFITEARISARLEHQNLVRIQQFNRQGDLYYLVMEYIDGITFRKIISQCRRHRLQVPVELVAELGRQVCEGLHYAHNLTDEHGDPLHLVHRDVKPSNLMLNTHGVTKVLDFGISSAHGTPESAGAVKGTWGYMALEQAEALAVGPAADVFGLGAVLFELAALEPLFGEKDNAVVRQRLLEDAAAARAAALGGPYSDLGGVLVRALQRDPEARHRNAAALGRALSSLVVDPVGVHDGLVRLLRDLRALDGSAAAQSPEKARSVSTMSRAGPPSRGSPRIEAPPALPVRFGDAHGVGQAPRAVPPRPASSVGAWLAGGAMLLVALVVIGFAGWLFLFGPSPRSTAAATAPIAPGRPLSEALGNSATPAAPASGTLATGAAPPVVVPASTGLPASPAPSAASASSARPGHAPATVAPPSGESHAPPRTSPPAAVPPSAQTEPAAAHPASAEPPVRIAAPANGGDPAPADKGSGLLTISSMPHAQVLVDGQYVRYTPIFQDPISAGSHTILLVADDGRRKSFRVDVQNGVETRRVWLFDEERWSDQ